MGMKSTRNGFDGEAMACKYLHEGLGMWVHPVARSANGSQPVDIIALRDGDSFLFDVKFIGLGKKSFPFADVQPNQITSMKLARKRSDAKCGFLLYFEESFEDGQKINAPRILPFDKFLELEGGGAKSINMNSEDLIDGTCFDDFVRLR